MHMSKNVLALTMPPLDGGFLNIRDACNGEIFNVIWGVGTTKPGVSSSSSSYSVFDEEKEGGA